MASVPNQFANETTPVELIKLDENFAALVDTINNLNLPISFGTMAQQNANSVSITGGSITGVTITGLTGVASSGANSDITSLSGLTTPLSIGQGGTGASTAPNARTALGAAASGAVGSSDLTMTTARVLGRITAATGAIEELVSVPVSLGGTGATDNATARTNLGLGTASDVTFNSVTDSKGELRRIPQNAQTSAYVLVASDAGKHISITTGGVTINTGVFSVGDAISIYNNSASNQTITQGTSVTMYLVGTATTGNRTLAQRGLASILCVGTNTFVISGGGLT